MDDIRPGDVCSRCGATVRLRRGPDGSLEGGVDLAPSVPAVEGSLEGGVEIGPGWDCDCAGADGPHVD
jgi:hypothetical protein